MGELVLVCLACGREHSDFRLRCDQGCAALLRSRYRETSFAPKPVEGIFRFLDWLPSRGGVETGIGPVVLPCEEFGRRLGLESLFCAFNGYWPERGAGNATGTFKDFEALPTVMTLMDQGRRRIVLSSAGNTARAFAYAAQLVDFEVYIVIPEEMLDRMWLPEGDAAGRVRVLAVKGGADYYDAIRLGEEIARRYGLDAEGGARNVARRDGMGTVLLEAARVLGRLPDHYVQAVGSGTGGIAAHEAALRLLADPGFQGQRPPRLHLSQNAPFLPIYRAWAEGLPIDPDAYARGAFGNGEVYATVLTNRNPPYALRGGVADALEESGGAVYAVSNRDAVEAGRELAECLGVDLEPAAAVAAASLKEAVRAGRIGREDLVLLNVTGGGFDLLRRDYPCPRVEPTLFITPETLGSVSSIL